MHLWPSSYDFHHILHRQTTEAHFSSLASFHQVLCKKHQIVHFEIKQLYSMHPVETQFIKQQDQLK